MLPKILISILKDFLRSLFVVLQESVPLRVKAIHIVNQPYIFNMVFALFKPFLRDKLRSRIHFHGDDRNSLHEHLSPKCLPDCYGGHIAIPTVTGSQWLELLIKCDVEYEGEKFLQDSGFPSFVPSLSSHPNSLLKRTPLFVLEFSLSQERVREF